MEATRPFWATAGIGLVLATLGPLAGRPILLLGAAGVGSLLVARQWAFASTLRRLDERLAVETAVSREYVQTGEETAVTLSATLDDPAPVDVRVSLSLPLSAIPETGEDLTITIPAGDRRAEAVVAVTWSTVGTATFERPTVAVVSEDGLFAEALPRGPTPRVVVEPRGPREIHVGEGGERVGAAFGGHRAGRFGQGIDPAELRQYTPGDAVSNIDWKATARQAEPYVREYEVETDQRTIVLFDHRATMDQGRPAESKLVYCRAVALAFVGAAEEMGDPIGLYGVGDEGVTVELAPGTDAAQYRTVRTRLHGFEPTTDAGTGPDAGSAGPETAAASPAAARRRAAVLAGDDSAFATRLRPYFERSEGYVRRIESDPLFRTARIQRSRFTGGTRTVIFTDDTGRTELRETVKLARRGSGTVVVFLAPSVLFEARGLADLERAYDRYREFEEFRRELAALDRVSAFEVGPGDRIEAVLAIGRERRVER